MSRSIKANSFLNRIRRIIFEASHLAPYLPLMKESTHQKVERMIGDKSNVEGVNAMLLERHELGHREHNWVERLLFSKGKGIDPCQQALLFWYVWVFFAIIYYYVEVGIVIAFGEVAWDTEMSTLASLLVDVLFIVVFMADVVVQFKAGFLYRGMIIMEKERIVARYLHFWFWVDVLLILVLIATLASGSYYMNYARTVVVMKFGRIFEVDNFYLRKLSIHRIRKTLFVIGKQIILIFLLSHTIGLPFYMMDNYLVGQPLCQDNSALCWLESSTAYSPINSYGWQIQYFYTLYWGVNTISTISYGDIAANNTYEVPYSLITFCFGFFIYAYVLNNIIKVILWATALRDQFRAETIIMDTYMVKMGISSDTRQQVKDYLEFRYLEEKNRSMDLEEEMKAKLPEELRIELVKSAYRGLYQGLQSILGTGIGVVRLLFFLKQKKYTSNELIQKQGFFVNSLLYLHKGQIKLECRRGATVKQLALIYQASNQFVSLSDFFLNNISSYDVLAEKGSIFYFISRQHLEAESLKDTEVKENVRLVEYSIRIKRSYEKIFEYCFVCGSKAHIWKECNDLFPNFLNIAISRSSIKTKVQTRRTKKKVSCLKEREMLRSLRQISVVGANQILLKLQKRVRVVRERIVAMKELFEVDSAYEWNHYEPHFNLSKIKPLKK